MLWMLSFALAATTVEADFDNDGKKEKLVPTENELVLPGLGPIDCVGECALEVLDIAADKPGKELSVCTHGPRDWVGCSLYRMEKGAWKSVPFPEGYGEPSAMVAKGNGFLLTYSDDRWYSRAEKWAWENGGVKRFSQPFYATANDRKPNGFVFTPDRSFPIYATQGGAEIVANVAPKNQVSAILEAPQAEVSWDDSKRWFLVRLQSGLVGWATLASIIGSSDELTMINSAG